MSRKERRPLAESVSVSLTPEVFRELAVMAKADDRTVGYIARRLILEALAYHKAQNRPVNARDQEATMA